MVFIIRDDILPPNCDTPSLGQKYIMKIELKPNISLIIQSVTYAKTSDPSFNCDSVQPDMVIAMKACLYVYI